VRGSPAAQPGITTSDEIFKINGKSASEMAFDYAAIDRNTAPIALELGSDSYRRETSVATKILLK
jgi:C-terminal processing protease CtpA/Prc